MRRRLLVGTTAALALTGLVLVLPVLGEPGPEAVPVETSVVEVAMGSLGAPAPAAEVQEGTTEPVDGVPAAAPALSVRATDVAEFSLVGVTWAADPAVTDTVVQVRVRDLAGSWGTWTQVAAEAVEQAPDADAGPGSALRGGTAPLWTGPATAVEAELVTRAGAQPTDVRLDLVDPGESAADAALGDADIQDTADAAVSIPPVFSRAQWGADESLMGWKPQYASTIKAATLHHTADANGYTADQVPAMLRSIYRYHAVSLGWGDIGYNVLADRFGRLWEGRAGGLASTVVGAHAGGFNTSTFGVSMIGNYDTVDTPQVMVDAVAAIIAWKFDLYGVDPKGTTTLTSGGTDKYAAGVKVTLPTVFGHRDTKSTACPGRYGYARLGEIRNAVAARMASARTPIADRYASDAGLRAWLGAPVDGEQSAAGVTWQVYANGARLYSSPAGGVRLVLGGILERYLAAGGPAVLGPPVSDDAPVPGGRGAFVRFQNGDVYWSPETGAQVVRGEILTAWLGAGGATGRLGFPTTSDARTPEGRGFVVRFEGGDVYWSPTTRARVVVGSIRDTWLEAGGPGGYLGFPTSDDTPAGGGASVRFEGGEVLWSPATGTRIVRGHILDTYRTAGGPTGYLGFPTTSDAWTPDGRAAFVRFEGGDVYWSPDAGSRVVRGHIRDAHRAAGGPAGFLGLPLTGDAWTPDGRAAFVRFEGGEVYWSVANGTRVVRGDILAAWRAAGGRTGVLGLPTTTDAPTPDGRGAFVRFDGGDVYWSPATGARLVRGGILATWLGSGGVTGPLGYPVTSDAVTADGRGAFVRFQYGEVYWSPPTGMQIVRGGILATWLATGGTSGPLGFPVTSDARTPDGRGFVVRFQGGDVYWSPTTDTQVVAGPTAVAYRDQGGTSSPLGFPTRSTRPVTGGTRTDFERGSMTWSSATGAVTVAP